MTKKAVERWKDIYTTYDESEAAIIVGLLEEMGVTCRVESARISAIPVSVGKMGELKVLVHLEDADKAVRLLEEAQAQQEEES